MAIDPVTGRPTGEDIHVDNPVGLAALDDHTLLAVSGKQVVKVDVRSKAVTPLIASGLVAPDSITTDRAGNIYVSDWATSFQVKVFSAAGKFLHAIGKPGGRPWVGKWDPSGMLVPRGVAVTDAGRLWVAEDDGSPKRISVWEARTGSLLRDYIGPTQYGGGTLFWIDPKDPTLLHAEGTTFKLDYARKAYTPLAIDYRRRSRDDPFTPDGHDLAVHGRVEIADRFDGFDLTEAVAGKDVVAGVGQLDVDDVGQLVDGEFGDAQGTLVAVDFDPLVRFRVAQLFRIHGVLQPAQVLVLR
jgi:hypothetical protein